MTRSTITRWARRCLDKPRVELLENRCLPTTITVTSAADNFNDLDTLVTLREAIFAANSDKSVSGSKAGSGPDIIDFDPSLAGATITLDSPLLGDLEITSDITIQGLGAGNLTIDAANLSRIFAIDNGKRVVTIADVTLTNGNALGGGGAIDGNNAILTIRNAVLTGNTATLNGGAISMAGVNKSALTIIGSTITKNGATLAGGGIYAVDLDSVDILNSTISSNVSVLAGGGIFAAEIDDGFNVRGSFVTDNHTADAGGGIFATMNKGDIAIQGSTIDGNVAIASGGGIFLNENKSVSLVSSKFTFNDAAVNGGGIFATKNNEVIVLDCTIADNDAVGLGGGIASIGVADNPLRITNSAIYNNTAAVGGGIHHDTILFDSFILENSTVSSNHALVGGGGGVSLVSGLGAIGALIRNSTIAFNTAILEGGGLRLLDNSATIQSTIIAKNTGNAPIVSDLVRLVSGAGSSTVNVIRSLLGIDPGSGTINGLSSNNLVNVDPLLGPLTNNGGPTFTHALLTNSPAINKGFNPAGLTSDQRETAFARTVGIITDIGAFEVQPVNVPVIVSTGGPYTVSEGGTLNLATTVSDGDVGQALTVEWDVNGDGTFDVSTPLTATGSDQTASASLTWTQLEAAGVNDGNATPLFTMKIRVTDNAGETDNAIDSLKVNNTSPTASIGNNGPVSEGSNATVTLSGPFDPSGADTTAGFHYAYDFDNDGIWDVGNGTYVGSGITNSVTLPTLDNPSRVVRARIIDKDDGFTDYLSTITVTNAPPTATGLNNGGPVNEGGSTSVSFVGATDPSPVDATSLRYSYDFDNNGTFDLGDGTYAGSAGVGSSAVVPTSLLTDGPATLTVRAVVLDKDNGVSASFFTTITILNVAPTATVSNNGPVNDGSSSATVSFSNQFDPSPVDTAAGFRYAYDFNNDGDFADAGEIGDGTYAGSSTSTTVSVPSVYVTAVTSCTVRMRIIDKDNGFTDYTTIIIVINSPPIGPSIFTIDPTSLGLLATTPTAYIARGCGEIIFQVGGVSDPDPRDDPVGFTYQFDWDTNGTVNAASPPAQTADPFFFTTVFHQGTYHPRVRAVDQNGNAGVWVPLDIPTLEVPAAALFTDASGAVNLTINGLMTVDSITVNAYNAQAVTVTMNGVNYGPFALSTQGHIIIAACDGADIMSLSGYASFEVHGGFGNDTIYGGSGHDVIYGDDGNDFITAGIGNDVVVGGLGKDVIQGGNDADILVGGAVIKSTYTWSALRSISDAWAASTTTPPPSGVDSQLQALRAGTTDANAATEKDTLTGGVGKDVFIYRATPAGGPGVDVLSDYKVAEKDYLLALLS